MLCGVPYSLKGNSVVKSDSGEVVKTHPTREKALAHLRALKANVEEGSPAVLGALLEGFDSGKHPRGALGRWIATFSHPVHGRTTYPVQASSSSEALEKAKALKMGTVQSVEPHDPEAHAIVKAEGRGPARPASWDGTPRALPTSRRIRKAGVQEAEERPEVLGALLEGR